MASLQHQLWGIQQVQAFSLLLSHLNKCPAENLFLLRCYQQCYQQEANRGGDREQERTLQWEKAHSLQPQLRQTMPSAPQAGRRAPSLSGSGIMTSTTFIKDTGILRVLPLGLFLLSMLVSGVSGAATTTPQSSTASSTNQPSSTTNEVDSTTTTKPTTATTTSSSSLTLGTSSLTTKMNISDMTENGTTKIYCPSFNCNYSDCYSMYISQNTTPCAVDNCCQLLRQTDMWYTASCSNSCADSCKNASQTNCAVNCCNFTGCLNYTFASMMSITTNGTQTTKPTTTQAPTTTTTSQTTANKGNKCRSGTCTGAKCYTSFTMLQICSSSEPHCQLKNESTDTATKWTAGCTNCTGYTACKASTKPPCNLECCNATMTSCLWLNGTLNVPSFATRGPYLHTELIASLLCIVAIAFLL